MTLTLKRATRQAVEYACKHFHYARRVPQTVYAYNVYEGEEWAGCVIFGYGATHGIATGVGYNDGEVVELERMALNGRQSTTSAVVAAALKQLHKDAPQIKAVVSYADQNQGHVGVIYQATNWFYLGDTKATSGSKPDAFLINGKKLHPRTVGSKGWKQSEPWLRENIDPNAKAIWGLPKYKYVFVFDKWERKKWLKKALPYPKKGDTDGKATEGNKQNRV